MNIPTAEEFLEYRTPRGIDNVYPDYWKAMIEFTKLHLEAQTEAILKITHKNGIPRIVDNKQSIIDSYSIDNIK